MKKVVLKLDLHDDKAKQKAMKVVSGLSGVDSISMDMKDKKLTVTGDIDAVVVVGKLRKLCHTDIVSVGPAKEPEKKKEEPKKEEPKKPDDKKKEDPPKVVYTYPPYYNPPYYQQQYSQHPMAAQYYANARSVEEDPNGCVIS